MLSYIHINWDIKILIPRFKCIIPQVSIYLMPFVVILYYVYIKLKVIIIIEPFLNYQTMAVNIV